jgi:hypothetical protein
MAGRAHADAAGWLLPAAARPTAALLLMLLLAAIVSRASAAIVSLEVQNTLGAGLQQLNVAGPV